MKSSRVGVSLIETVISMTVASVVLSGGIGVIHMMLDIDRNSRHSIELTTTISRLSQVFRRDVHAAHGAQASTSGEGGSIILRLQQPTSQTVTYEAHANRLVRTQRNDSESVNHQDEFVFPRGFQIELATRRVSVLVRHSGDDRRVGPRDAASSKRNSRAVIIEATLGRDNRFVWSDS